LGSLNDFRKSDTYFVIKKRFAAGFEDIFDLVFAGKFKAYTAVIHAGYGFLETLGTINEKKRDLLPISDAGNDR
jgi:hypothetical protein